MDDTIVSKRQERSWLLLIPQLPAKPDYLRVKLQRRLQKIGALALKNSVYLLPLTEETVEDCVWLRTALLADGGDLVVCRTALLSGITDDGVVERFQAARAEEYREVAGAVSALRAAEPEKIDTELRRMRRRMEEIVEIDFFGAPDRATAEAAFAGVSQADAGAAPETRAQGATWVTRTNVFADRIASAWLIRRFIDRNARFRFAEPGYVHAAGEIRFDMFDGEYTHEGERCTFEVLLERHALGSDAALRAIGEIVHDIDMKEERYARPETPGIHAMLRGLRATEPSDDARLRIGGELFEALYRQFSAA